MIRTERSNLAVGSKYGRTGRSTQIYNIRYIYYICYIVYGVWVCVFACVRLRVIASDSMC